MRKFMIFGLAGAATGLALLWGTPQGHASEQPWCIIFGGSQGSIENCGMRTFEECREEMIAGNRGSCFPNPYFQGNWQGNAPRRSGAQRKY
jgi:Protein of unknown function (DUF3551)